MASQINVANNVRSAEELAPDEIDDGMTDVDMEHVIVCEKGDVNLQCQTKVFLVSSLIMALSSPVFERMFNSGFKESLTPKSVDNPLAQPLPDDDEAALEIILRLLHHSKKVPDKVDRNTVFRIAILYDKYRMDAFAVQAACGKWMPVAVSVSFKPDSGHSSFHQFQAACNELIPASVPLYLGSQSLEDLWAAMKASFLLGLDDRIQLYQRQISLRCSHKVAQEFHRMFDIPDSVMPGIVSLRSRLGWMIGREILAFLAWQKGGYFEFSLLKPHQHGCSFVRVKKIVPRRSVSDWPDKCDFESRAKEVTLLLGRCWLWPEIKILREQNILDRIKKLTESCQLNGVCDSIGGCPLSTTKSWAVGLYNRTQQQAISMPLD